MCKTCNMQNNTPNIERIKLFVAALRSGEYEQGQNVLTGAGKNCCLGVACQVAMKHGLKIKTTVESGDVTVYDGSSTMLPYTIVNWFGFDSVNPIVNLPEPLTIIDDSGRYVPRRCDAIGLNDTFTQPFTVIADAFENTFIPENER